MGKKHKTTCRWDVFWADILRTISQFYQYLLYRLYVSSNKVVYRLSGDQKLICTFIIGHLRTAQIAKNCFVSNKVSIWQSYESFRFLELFVLKLRPCWFAVYYVHWLPDGPCICVLVNANVDGTYMNWCWCATPVIEQWNVVEDFVVKCFTLYIKNNNCCMECQI